MWECGLKFESSYSLINISAVTPLVGVWIEIIKKSFNGLGSAVTPLVGVWIEIERVDAGRATVWVTPLVGVWIEIVP